MLNWAYSILLYPDQRQHVEHQLTDQLAVVTAWSDLMSQNWDFVTWIK